MQQLSAAEQGLDGMPGSGMMDPGMMPPGSGMMPPPGMMAPGSGMMDPGMMAPMSMAPQYIYEQPGGFMSATECCTLSELGHPCMHVLWLLSACPSKNYPSPIIVLSIIIPEIVECF